MVTQITLKSGRAAATTGDMARTGRARPGPGAGGWHTVTTVTLTAAFSSPRLALDLACQWRLRLNFEVATGDQSGVAAANFKFKFELVPLAVTVFTLRLSS